jgi:Chlamydia polymorphic membrane protein (Chlamydia_PMP) repeat
MSNLRSTRARLTALVGTLALAAVGAVALSAPAGATNVNDETSFRNAWTNDTQIDLDNDITLSGGGGCTGVAIRNSANALTLDGHGHTITQQCANNGVLQQDGSGAVTLNNVTITGGDASGDGGGLKTSSANVTVNNSTFSNNTAGGSGGAINESAGNVSVTNSTFSGNKAENQEGGAIRESSGNVTVTNSTFSGNSASGSGAEGGAIRESSGNVTVTNSTFSGNTASGSGAEGGAIRESDGNVTATNSTFTGNTATGTSGPEGGAIRGESSDVTLVYATVVSNTSPEGANIWGGGLTSFGSVVALAQGGGNNCSNLGSTTSNGFNFTDDASCNFPAGEAHSGVDPGLAALADNGGSTQTRLPQPGSPLIDAIPNASCQADGASGIATDQRGLPRPEVTGGLCDIGAVEVQPPGPGPAPRCRWRRSCASPADEMETT